MPKFTLRDDTGDLVVMIGPALDAPPTDVVAVKGQEWVKGYIEDALQQDPEVTVQIIARRLASPYDGSQDKLIVDAIDTKDAPVTKGDTLTALIARVRAKRRGERGGRVPRSSL